MAVVPCTIDNLCRRAESRQLVFLYRLTHSETIAESLGGSRQVVPPTVKRMSFATPEKGHREEKHDPRCNMSSRYRS